MLLRDTLRGNDARINAAARVIAEVAADVIVLQGIDYDLEGRALSAFADVIAGAGVSYRYQFALRPNRGLRSGLDLDGDGRTGGPGDAQGFGTFSGAGGMAILSRFPIQAEKVADFSDLLWRDMPGALLPQSNGLPYPSAEAQAVQRLSTSGHWVVPVSLPDGRELTLLTFHASPPVFDGPEDLNGRRNHDEILFWRHFLDGAFGPAPSDRFVLLGDANLDPEDSDGRPEAILSLLNNPRLQDPMPTAAGGVEAANVGHSGDPALDTADWDEPSPGNLRVDYVLPSADWQVAASGVYWPASTDPAAADVVLASRHRVVWVDLVTN